MSRLQETNVVSGDTGVANKAAAIAFVRIAVGVMWLFEVTVGNNWKLGGFGSGLNPEWFGPNAGAAVTEQIGGAVEDGTWGPAAWLFQNVMEPNAAAMGYLVVALQVTLGLVFIFGGFVRPVAIMAIAFDLSVFLLGSWRIPTLFITLHLFLVYTNAGRHYGLDAVLVPRLRRMRGRAARLLRQVNEVAILQAPKLQSALLALTVLLATFFFLETLGRPTERMSLVAMELAVITGLLAAGLYCARRPGREPFAVALAALRIYVGVKLLQYLLVINEPGVNALPGGTPISDLSALFEEIAAHHWAPVAWLISTGILPAIGLWAAVFTAVQFAVGAALVTGWQTRAASLVGVGYLGVLIGLGFTRVVPFVLILLIAVLVLDSGRELGFDSARERRRSAGYWPLLPGRFWVMAAGVVAVGFAVVTVIVGVSPPGDYTESMRSMVTAMIAILLGAAAAAAGLSLRSARSGTGSDSAARSETAPLTRT